MARAKRYPRSERSNHGASAPTDLDSSARMSDDGGEEDPEEYVERRHRQSYGKEDENAADNSSVDNFDVHMPVETTVMDIDISSSESDTDYTETRSSSERKTPLAQKSLSNKVGRSAVVSVVKAGDEDYMEESSDDDGDEDGIAQDLDDGWGGRRRMWYGGDTHDYETMPDEERETALREEEQEAKTKRSQALDSLLPQDFFDSSDEQSVEEGKMNKTESKKVWPQHTKEQLTSTDNFLPETSALVADLRDCMKAMRDIRVCATRSHSDLICYHANASLASSIAFFLSLRTDPDLAGVNPSTHAVVNDLCCLRSLWKTCNSPTWKRLDHALQQEENRSGDCGNELVVEPDSTLPKSERMELGSFPETRDGTNQEKQKIVFSEGKSISPPPSTQMQDKLLERTVGYLETKPGAGENEMGLDDLETPVTRKSININMFIGSLERERKNHELRRGLSTDMEPARENTSNRSKADTTEDVLPSALDLASNGELQLPEPQKKKKRSHRADSANDVQPHQYRFDDSIKDKDLRRRANSQIVLNRGLTRRRRRDRKTPRAKNREAFSKALKKRRSVVRDPVAVRPDSYGGEASGINMRSKKSSTISDI